MAAEALNLYSAILAFETGIEPVHGETEGHQYSLSLILFRAPEGEAWATAEKLGRSDDEDLPFVTGWRFAGVLDVDEVEPPDTIVQGSEVYSCFVSSGVLEALRRALARPSPIEEATGRRHPA